MKALILAAGFGTRLLPFTRTVPKPLFTLAGKTVLEMAIRRLALAGCSRILVNTHHLHDQVAAFVENLARTERGRSGPDIQCIHEPVILDTGGAMANVRALMGEDDFFVVNADVVCDVDLDAVLARHRESKALATLLLHDRAEFNMVTIDDGEWITDFRSPENGLAFTGIQVVSPKIFSHFPEETVFSSIDVYRRLCPDRRIKALVARDIYWEDIGTPDAYRSAARQWIAAAPLDTPVPSVSVSALAGDGSDRRWFRAASPEGCTVVISDHGICLPESDGKTQLSAFVHIGNHLHGRGIPVPRILAHDRLSGMVALEDLGNTHLADAVAGAARDESRISVLYKTVIDELIRFSREGAKGFDTAWTCQTPAYSRDLILDYECRYFLEAFVNRYCGKDIPFEFLEDEFEHIAEKALEGSVQGLMHRDFQSRNIMLRDGTVWFIDFQSARLGPFQYDLASLLIDPYVTLSRGLRQDLRDYALTRIGTGSGNQAAACFRFCCLTRNLQILGAFAFLSQVKGKPGFQAHIPAAVRSLKQILTDLPDEPLPRLTQLVTNL